MTTSTILAGLDAQDNAAWERLAGRFRQPIVAFAKKVGLSETDAEDVAQETLIAFAHQFRCGQFDPAKGRLSKWLFGIAHRQALNERRQGARRTARGATVDSGILTAIADEGFATTTWDQEWERSILDQCLERVRGEVAADTYRAFELVVQDEKTPAEVANILQTPIKQVYNAKHRVLKRIRELRLQIEEIS